MTNLETPSTNTPVEFIRLKDVLQRLKVSRSHIMRMIAAKKFPAGIRLSERIVVWDKSEVDTWALRHCKRQPEQSSTAA